MMISRILPLVAMACFTINMASCKFAANIADAQTDQPTVQETEKQETGGDTKEEKEPDFITVQHILIGYKGSVGDKPINRSKEEAKKLAEKILKTAKEKPDEFDAFVKQHTDDAHPGIYQMANDGQKGDMSSRNQDEWIFERRKMVGAFGNVGFKLKVGEIGMAEHDAKVSPYGWHIIKRIK